MSLFDNLAYRSQDDLLKKIIQVIEDGYAAKRRPREIIKKNSFSPSSIGYMHNRCPRLWAMKFAGRYYEEDNTSLQSIGVMSGGTGSHERIQEAMEHSGVVKNIELEITNEDPPIRGFVDVLAEFDGEDIPIEIKTTRTEAFQSRMLKMKGPPYQMYQILIYMYILKAKRGVLLYENTNDKRMLAVPVEMTDENRGAVEKALEWMRKVWQAHKEDKLPARPWKKTSPNCAGCPLFNECWSEPREDIKIKSMSVHPW